MAAQTLVTTLFKESGLKLKRTQETNKIDNRVLGGGHVSHNNW
jgi:hypothetical protein